MRDDPHNDGNESSEAPANDIQPELNIDNIEHKHRTDKTD